MLKGSLVGLLFALSWALPAWADGWVAANVRGSALALVGSQWQELRPGDAVGSGVVVRTLQAGSVVLRREGDTLQVQLGPNTSIRTSLASGPPTLEQYTGQLSLSERGPTAWRVVTPAFTATLSAGSLISRLAGKAAVISVQSGEVQLSAGRGAVRLAAGQSYRLDDTGNGTLSGPTAAAATGAVSPAIPSAGTATGAATGAVDGKADGGKTDNGVGNGGVPGNGGQNGNAGGNGAGGDQGNGNGGGNGNGNGKS